VIKQYLLVIILIIIYFFKIIYDKFVILTFRLAFVLRNLHYGLFINLKT
jgi:hypothetical protein